MKRKQIDIYLSDDDIEKLHHRYEELFKQVKDSESLTPAQIDKECDVLSRKYDFEVEKLSRKRKKEYLEEQAKIDADDAEQIPWRRGWWWKLIFQPLTNRAQDIIELQAALDAEEKFAPLEKDLDAKAEKLYAGTGKKLSQRKRQRLMKKYLKLRDKLISDNFKSDDAARDAEPQSLQTSNAVQQQVDDLNAAIGEYKACTDFRELKAESTYKRQEQNGEDITESPAAVADVQSGAEPPEPPARQPRKPKQQRGTTP